MHADLFQPLEGLLEREDPIAGFDFLIDRLLSAAEYGLVFEARLMEQRFRLGLPLVQTNSLDSDDYQQAVLEAAREAGRLFLASGNIERAWPYFRAISEPAPVADAIAGISPDAASDALIAIAFQEGVHPLKGLEFILARHGICRAITSFGMLAVAKDREPCIALLARNLHAEIVSRIGRAIEDREGSPAATSSLVELMNGRDWLFGEWDCYVDTSHLASVVPYGIDVAGRAVLEVFHELCEYGRHLSPQFQPRGAPPFEDLFGAYGHYIQALLGNDVERHVEYFRQQVAGCDPETAGDAAARILVRLLVALHRPAEALPVLLESVVENSPYGAEVPSALQLCYQANDFTRMKALARERGDVLSYFAADILKRAADRG
ncbi:MAG TPA: hypothetical protein VME43_02175 [Bryobacteraceae bacterium]|nr:hypothetical protein [Bryobacteraceae bacterium]